MSNIVAIMGKSSSGKDTIFKILADDADLQFQHIVSYTTRPMRDGECNGVEYFFTNEEGFQNLKDSGMVIEDRSYNTVMGVWRYFTVNDCQFNCCDKDFIMICTLESYKKMMENMPYHNFIPIYIHVDDEERLQRALIRESKQKIPKYYEMYRRFLSDQIDFSDDNLYKLNINKIFINDNLDQCIEEIKQYLKEQM